MLPTVFIAFSLLAHPSDTWDLKPSFAPKAKIAWSVSADITTPQTIQATFQLVEQVKEGDASKGQPVHLEISDVEVNGSSQSDIDWDGLASTQNLLSGGEEDPRRTLNPLVFVYPSTPVKVGDTWKAETTPATKDTAKVSYEFTAKGVEAVNGADALKVSGKVTETGTDSLSSDGTWWVDKTGKVVKFAIDAKNWFVAGTGHSFDVHFAGELKK